MNGGPVINPTPYDPRTFHEVTTRVAVQVPWHHDPVLFYAAALIFFALLMMVVCYWATRSE